MPVASLRRASRLGRRHGLRRRGGRLLVSVVVFPAAVMVSSQLRLQLGDCGVERGVKIGPAGFGAHGAALPAAEDCNPRWLALDWRGLFSWSSSTS